VKLGEVDTGHRPDVHVLHSTAIWLPQTQPWLHDLVRFLPEPIVSHIAAERIENIEQFPVSHLHARENRLVMDPLARRALRRVGQTPAMRHVRRVAETLRPTVIHSHFGNRGWADIGAAAATGARLVTSFYGLDVDQIPRSNPVWRERYRELFKKAQWILVLGPRMAERVRKLECPDEKTLIHHVGVDVARIAFRPRRWEAGRPLRVLMAASFREKKGIPLGLEALARLRKRLPVAITLIGDVNEEARSQRERARILATVERWKIGDQLRLMGYQPHGVLLQEAYRHDILMSPSLTASDGDTEGTPVTLMEMMASGMPVVSTFHSDIPEVVQHGRTGRLGVEGDPQALLEQLEWLIEHPSEWAPMLTAARAHIESEFDARRQGERLAAIYLDAARRRAVAP
jgi:colanic acid/amylovoran biosynthesis glycosyltransferase